ncbi:MAG: BspA family leucine-rich repeat surface protein [Chloroflexota bacterium]
MQINNQTFGQAKGKNSQYYLSLLLATFLALILLAAGTVAPAAAADADDFVITVKTDNDGTSSDTEYTIPTTTGATYNYNVDCNGDGTDEVTGHTSTTGYTCDYGPTGLNTGAGTYTIRIKDNVGDGTGFPRIRSVSSTDQEKLLTIEQWGTGNWTSMESAFSGCSNLTITATDAPDLALVTDMSRMFFGAKMLNQDISHWNTSNVQNMSSMFSGAEIFNQPLAGINGWDTSQVTNMSSMFSQAKAFDQPLGGVDGWDTSQVTNMSNMFNGAEVFNQPLGGVDGWDTSQVTNMSSMFSSAKAFNQPLGGVDGWDTSQVTNMSGMFRSAEVFNQPLPGADGWDTSKVTNMSGMFSQAKAFDQPIGDWETGLVTSMHSMFSGANAFNQPIGGTNGWDTSNVTNMSSMFSNAYVFDQPIGNWDTSKVTSMSYMFSSARAFNQPLIDWETGLVTNMSGMFSSAYEFNHPIGGVNGWDTSNVTNMSSMFSQARAFNQPLPGVDGWDTSKVTSMSHMFSQAHAFNQPVGDWETGLVENMSSMFSAAHAFNQPIGGANGWDTSKVTSMSYMFSQARAFDQPIGNWDTDLVTNMSGMFSGATVFNQSLTSADGWDTSMVTNMSSMFSSADAFNQPLGDWETGLVENISYMFIGTDNFDQDLGGWDVSSVTNAAGFLSSATLSTANYDALLNGWNAQTLNNGVTFDGGNSTYCAGATARANMISSDGWSIDDDGEDCSAPPSDPNDDFVIKVQTDNFGTSADDQFTIPTYPGETYNYNVDCNNDGTDEAAGVTGDYTCDYSGAADEYIIRIKDNNNDGMGFPHIYFNEDGDRRKLKEVMQWGTGKWKSMHRAFEGCSNLIITAPDMPDLSGVTDMSYMFASAENLSGNIGGWVTSNVENMSNMFASANNFNQNIDGWDTRSVTDMSGMFLDANYFNQDIGGWNTLAVTNMSRMFETATRFNQDIGEWKTDNVTNMNEMFFEAYAFNQDIGEWKTDNVANMGEMFASAIDFNQDIGGWNVTSLTDAGDMLESTHAFSTTNYDALLLGWSTQALNNNVDFGAGNNNYCAGAAARDVLVNTYNWNIDDGGLDCSSTGPSLGIANTTIDASNGTMSVPVDFAAGGAGIASLAFSIDYQESCLTYDSISGVPAGFVSIVNDDAGDTDGELDILIYDGTVPIETLSDGAVVSITFNILPACITTDGTTTDTVIGFSSDPAPSMGGTDTVEVPIGSPPSDGTVTMEFNATPTDIGLSPSSVAENEASDTTVGTLSTTDPDSGDSHTYALVSGSGDDDNDSFTLDGDEIKTDDTFDFEDKDSYTIRVRTTDDGGLNGEFEKAITITITDANDAPTDIALSPSSVAENSAVDTIVGTLSTTDEDAVDSHSYALVSGSGDDDNGDFTIDGNQIKTSAIFNFEVKDSYAVRVRTTDSGSLTSEKELTITITDVNEAPVAQDDFVDPLVKVLVGTESYNIDVLDNDSDEDAGDTPEVGSVTQPAAGSVTDNDSDVVFTAPDSNGFSSFTYQASDGSLNSNDETVTIFHVEDGLRGDCNDDGAITAADITAIVLEIFDAGSEPQHNGNPAWWLVHEGDYAGSPIGCDANAGENDSDQDSVTVADISCAILTFFGYTDCTNGTMSTTNGMPAAMLGTEQNGRSVNVTLNANGNDVASAAFALTLDPQAANFDATDKDGDGIPDAVVVNAPAHMSRVVIWNAERHELQVAIFGVAAELATLDDGVLATVTLGEADSDTGLAVEAVNGRSPLTLSNASLGNTQGGDVAVSVSDGELAISKVVPVPENGR